MNNFHSKNFSFIRVMLLYKKYFFEKKKVILIGGLIVAACLAIIYIPLAVTVPNGFKSAGSFNTMTLAFTIIAYAGYGLSSSMFTDLNSPEKAANFLTLPASSLEKLISAWLFSYVSYSIIGMAALYALSLILGMDSSVFIKMDLMYRFLIYTILHSIFFIGATYFKANNFLSTLMTIIVFIALFAVLILGLDSIGLSFRKASIFSEILIIKKSESLSHLLKNITYTTIVSFFCMWIALVFLKKRKIS